MPGRFLEFAVDDLDFDNCFGKDGVVTLWIPYYTGCPTNNLEGGDPMSSDKVFNTVNFGASSELGSSLLS